MRREQGCSADECILLFLHEQADVLYFRHVHRDIAQRQDEIFAFPFPIDGDKVRLRAPVNVLTGIQYILLTLLVIMLRS